jgi:SAM-dependent methyltransferase
VTNPAPAASQQLPATTKDTCSACGSGDLSSVVDLPNLPLTGIYVDKNDPPDASHAPVDQGLMLCSGCGHGQLLRVLDPARLYGEDYTHRGSLSTIATSGNDFFLTFLDRIAGGRRFKSAVEVGCSDLYMLRQLGSRAAEALGVDPIWRNREPEPTNGMRVLGRFVEQVDFATDVDCAPDLVVSAHTFEHLADPAATLQHIVRAAAPDALFVVEVPSLDTLIETSRFDQVFHQHIQYFSLESFKRRLARVGCVSVGHAHNWGMWGGTQLVAFRKTGADESAPPAPQATAAGLTRIASSLARFRGQITLVREHLEAVEDLPIFGFGAAQMLPVLAYHMDTDFASLVCILDDNPARAGMGYPKLVPLIQQPAPDLTLQDAAVVVTALDSVRPIIRRILPMSPRRVIVPVQMW